MPPRGGLEEIEVALVDHVGHAVARPHHLNALVQALAQCAQVFVVLVPSGIGGVILGGAHREAVQIVVLLNEVFPNIVALGHLKAGVGATKVVEEDGEVAHAQRVDVLQLVHHGLEVALAVGDASARVYRPHKRHVVLLGGLGQATDNGCLVGGIVLAPLGAVVGVVLGAVNIDVHLVLAVELKLALAVGVAPRIAVESLDHATLCAGGIVADLHRHHVGLGQYLQQGLHAVVGAGVVGASHDDAVGVHLEVIALSRFGNVGLHGAHGLFALLAHHQADAVVGQGELLLQQGHGVGVGGFGLGKAILGVGRLEGLLAPANRLRHRRHLYLLRPRRHLDKE